jgi:50S ribosomal protein L16 3-hydroxylase
MPAVAALARRFRFLPGVRFDDVMISVAGDGGGVGPHIDQYDVFLLQAWGRRRWRISRQRDTECVPGLPLRILADFRAEEEWDLGPGDLLYLPPGVAHEGVAQGPCMTISIGFRLPSWQSLAETWYEQQGEFSPLKGRLPGQVPGQGRNAGELPASFIPALLQALRRRQPGPQDARRALLANLSEPRPHVYFEPPQAPVSQAQFARSLARQGAHLDLRSRLFYSARMAGINGEACALSPAQLRAVKPLADQGYLPGHAVPQDKGLPDEDVLDLLYGWYCDGWLCMGAPSATA